MSQRGLSSVALAKEGQALIIILVAAAVALSVLTFATLAAIGQAKSSGRNELGRKVFYAAESGAEHALMKLMRDPTSCNGSENLTIDGSSVTINYTLVSGSCQVTSKATQGNSVKTISLQGSYDSSQIFNYSGWLETP
jgi:hypothetical protein